MDGQPVAFRDALAFGKIGEGYIASWFRRNGYNVLPVYEKEIHEGKGPVLFSTFGPFIAPDLLVFQGRNNGTGDLAKVRWIEAKTKTAFTWHRNTQRWTTGIDLRHYHDYLRIADFSPWPVWLMFLQLPGIAKDSPSGCPSGLFGNDLLYLRDHENHRHQNGGKAGMVYWASETLKLIASLQDVMGSA